MVVSVKAWNVLAIEYFEAVLNGESFFVMGDTQHGKTTLIELIQASLLLKPMPANFLRDGTDEGGFEVVHSLGDGHTYKVSRTIKRDNKKAGRFEVVNEHGKSDESLSDILARIFGLAFTNSYFDFQVYFYKLSSPQQRTEYFIKTIGGDEVTKNLREIKSKIEKRNRVGSELNVCKVMISQSPIPLDPETLQSNIEFYKKFREPSEADAAYETEMLKQKDKDSLLIELEEIQQANREYAQNEARIPAINLEIAALQAQIAALRIEKKQAERYLKNFPNDLELEKSKLAEIADIEEHNKNIEEAANIIYEDMHNTISLFNVQKAQFDSAFSILKKSAEYTKEHNGINDEIAKLKERNRQVIQERLPLPEISISEEGMVMYEDKELCFPHVSTGQGVRIAAKIQRALNPKGNNIIVIPDGRNLGSGIDEIIEESKNFGFQYIVEVTKRKEPLKIVFEEEFLMEDDPDYKKKVMADRRKLVAKTTGKSKKADKKI